MNPEAKEVMEKQEALINGNLNIIPKIASRLISSRRLNTDLYEDLVAAGQLGLVEAASRYREEEGVPFTAFAYLRIRGSMIDTLEKSSFMSRRRIRALRDSKSTSDDGVRIAHIESVDNSYLENICHDENHAEAIAIKMESARSLEAAMATLPEQEQEVVKRHYFLGESITEIAGGSEKRSNACKVHRKALLRMRKKLKNRN